MTKKKKQKKTFLALANILEFGMKRKVILLKFALLKWRVWEIKIKQEN